MGYMARKIAGGGVPGTPMVGRPLGNQMDGFQRFPTQEPSEQGFDENLAMVLPDRLDRRSKYPTACRDGC